MPPEPLPWDNRKDFFKEKKQQEQQPQQHDRSSADVSVAYAAVRWRDSPYHGSQDFVRGGSADGRPAGILFGEEFPSLMLKVVIFSVSLRRFSLDLSFFLDLHCFFVLFFFPLGC